MKKIIFIVGLALVITGCAKKTVQDAVDATTGLDAAETKFEVVNPQIAQTQCLELCRGAIREGIELGAGPCIGNPIPAIDDWVCDIAHNPRQDVDNKSENQCSAYASGQAKHFIEVDENCNVIKVN